MLDAQRKFFFTFINTDGASIAGNPQHRA